VLAVDDGRQRFVVLSDFDFLAAGSCSAVLGSTVDYHRFAKRHI
jgi:hypothetical protein